MQEIGNQILQIGSTTWILVQYILTDDCNKEQHRALIISNDKLGFLGLWQREKWNLKINKKMQFNYHLNNTKLCKDSSKYLVHDKEILVQLCEDESQIKLSNHLIYSQSTLMTSKQSWGAGAQWGQRWIPIALICSPPYTSYVNSRAPIKQVNWLLHESEQNETEPDYCSISEFSSYQKLVPSSAWNRFC